jgi:hypothetical protein
MGRIVVKGLGISMDTLQREAASFQKRFLIQDWMSEEKSESRRSVADGFTFLMLNLAEDVDQEAAWELYHEVMDEYHEICDKLSITY